MISEEERFILVTRLGALLVAADWDLQNNPAPENQAKQKAALAAYEAAVWEE